MLNNCARLYRAYQLSKGWKVISDALKISFRILHKRKSTTKELRPLNLFTNIKRTKDDSKIFFCKSEEYSDKHHYRYKMQQ